MAAVPCAVFRKDSKSHINVDLRFWKYGFWGDKAEGSGFVRIADFSMH